MRKETRYKCWTCDKLFLKQELVHEKVHSRHEDYKCPVCGKVLICITRR